jgi:hypothetical protein
MTGGEESGSDAAGEEEGRTAGENVDNRGDIVGQGLERERKENTDKWVAFSAATPAAGDTRRDEKDKSGAIAAGVH